MSAIDPTNNTGLIIDDFINYATAHLSTISGVVNTISLYPPLQTPGPAVILWSGYTVSPATVSAASISFENMTDAEAVVISDNAMQDMQDSINSIEIDEETYEVLTLPPEDFNSEELQSNLETTNGVNGLGNGVPDKIIKKIEEKKADNKKSDKKKEVKIKGKKILTNLETCGWLVSEEQPFRTTYVDPKEWGPKLKKLYGENIAKAMLACMKNEQGFKGFNNNIGGFDITAGRWQYNEKLHDGYVFATEGTTGLLKSFCSFKSLDTFFEKTSSSFIAKGMGTVKTADDFSKVYYKQWLGGDSATKYAFEKYPNIAKAKGGKFETLEDYRNATKKIFVAIYKSIEKAKYVV